MKVAVGMSGGVDSSVTAALLQREGHEVTGIFMRLGVGSGDGAERRCCSLEDGRDAERVARKLGIRFYDLDYRAAFRDSVIRGFVEGYLRGETPNPCATCNRDVKFGVLLKQAMDLGCDALATGHYARIVEGPKGPLMARGLDPLKDQSYFLFPISRENLGRIRFPLGGLTKKEVRQIAHELDLPTKKKSESMDICFVGQSDYADVLERERPGSLKPGEILHTDGRRLGRHEGQARHTIGQRRGLGIGGGDPLFVVGKDPAANTVTVGPRETLLTRRLSFRVHAWHSRPDPGDRVGVQIRYNAPALEAVIEDPGTDGSTAVLKFTSPEERTSPGQAAVVYDGDTVLGGGWILEGG